jgi:HEAT repeat protein
MNYNKKLQHIDKLKNDLDVLKLTLLKYADDKNALVRSHAIELLSSFYDGDIDRKILQRLNDKDYLVRVSALDAIMLPQNIDKVFKQISKLLNDKNWLVQVYAVEALGYNKAIKYHKKIKTMLYKNQNDEVLVRIYYALIQFGEKKYLKKLLKMLNSDYYRVRCAVSNTLYYLDNRSNHKLIIKKLNRALKKEKTIAAKSCISGTIYDLEKEYKNAKS